MTRPLRHLPLLALLVLSGFGCGSGNDSGPGADGGAVSPSGAPGHRGGRPPHLRGDAGQDRSLLGCRQRQSARPRPLGRPLSVATAVPGLTGVGEVAMGYEFSCARMQNGEASCWGANPGGALGNGGDAIQVSPTPLMLDDVDRFGALTLGHYSSCAIHAGGTLSCWATPRADSSAPASWTWRTTRCRSEAPDRGAEHLALGYFHVCVALSAGGVSCFGSNGWASCATTTSAASPSPAPSRPWASRTPVSSRRAAVHVRHPRRPRRRPPG